MKNFLLLLFIVPTLSFSQCKDPIGKSVDEGNELKSVVESYTKTTLSSKREGKGYIIYSDTLRFVNLRLTYSQKTVSTGQKETKVPPTISGIYISAPADRIDEMVKGYFEPQIQSCVKEKTNKWMTWKDRILVYADEGNKQGVLLKSIEIRRN